MKKRMICFLLLFAMMITALVGCSGNQTESGNTQPAETSGGTKTEGDSSEELQTAVPSTESEETYNIRGNTAPTAEEVAHVNESFDDSYLGDYFGFPLPNNYDAYPIEGGKDTTLDIFYAADGQFSLAWSEPNDHPMVEYLENLLGVDINLIVAAPDERATQLNLMISNGDIPDIIIGAAGDYPGGVAAGIEDGLFLDLTEHMDKLPNLSSIFERADDFRRAVTTDDGHIYQIWGIASYVQGGSPYAAPYICLNIKQEALEKTGLSVPETIDEMHDFLVACKEAGYEHPLTYSTYINMSPVEIFGWMFDAYGMEPGIYINDEGEIAYGYIDDRAEEYLKTFNAWYQEGLIQPDWASIDFSQAMAYACSEDSACVLESPDTMDAYWRQDNGIAFTYGNNLVLNKGDMPTYNWMKLDYLGGTNAVISSACENVDVALAFLDFGFTKKGWEVYGWGAYGENYHLIDENGIPYYPDDSYYYNSPDNLPTSTNIWKYRFHFWPAACSELIGNPLCTMGEGNGARIRQELLKNHDGRHYYPTLSVSLTPEESTRAGEINTELRTLTDEYYTGMMNGTRPISDFAEYQKLVEEVGVEELIKIYKDALDRYNAR